LAWTNELRLWTQDLYMACLACDGIPHSSTGIAAIRPTIREHTLLRVHPLAPPSVQHHPSRAEARANLRNADYRKARNRFGARLARALLVDLCTVLEAEMQARSISAGCNPNTGLEGNIASLKLNWAPYPWAYARCVELSAVRNCIVHNNQTWQSGQINRLTSIPNFPYAVPSVGQPIEVQLAHLFVYKSAVRQLLNL
jgi:hypothetical protein